MPVRLATSPADDLAPGEDLAPGVPLGFGAFPEFLDEVAFDSNPFDADQVYTAITQRTRLRSWSRGRQNETTHPDTGRSSLTFENMDRALDPENTESPYYPNVLPMRRTRSSATLDGVTYYRVFTTFVDPIQGWQLVQDEPGYSEAVAAANDGFDLLSIAQFTASDTFDVQTPGERINAILDRFGWPAGERAIDVTSAQQDIQGAAAGDLTGQSALDQINAAADTEDGVFFIDERGYAVFHDRYHQLLDDRATTSQATFVDHDNATEGAFFYESLSPSSSPIVNDYLVTRAGGTQVECLDETSKDTYGRRSRTLDTLHQTDAEATNFGNYKLAQTKDPHRRYDEMIVDPAADSDTWLICLQLKIGDRITVKQSPPGTGDTDGGVADVRDMHIEAISATVGPAATAKFTFRLSPVSQVVGWLLGTSVLGVDTVLVY